jgi:serine/threonine protein kinase/DNA-binding SARP family transcriptional activator/Tfp pilus assembly protein PilF
MLRLRAFGGLRLEGSGSAVGACTQRKCLALLALLAASDRPTSRDKLLARLWPEVAPDRASHRLAQTLPALRHDLRADALFLGAAELHLNPQAISSDVGDFRAALEAGDLEGAAGLYQGPFLDGFHLSDAPEFERWMEMERGHFLRRYTEVLETLASQAQKQGQRRRAAELWRQLATVDPLSSRVAVGYMEALAAAGDRAGALRFARVHEALRREELDAGPGTAVAALSEKLRDVLETANDPGPASPGEPTPGPRLGKRYQVLREVGRGGMANVYLARDLKHDREVAIKVLRPEIAAELGAERFLREIKLAAQLTHPHILPLYDSGETEDSLYYVMPFVEGESLRARLERERQLPIEDALRIAREVADALEYAHRHNTVHRDIKPENILLEAGHAVVADFGIARAITAAGDPNLTAAGTTLGTPAYMSPEQASGEPEIDGRSDQYCLACVLYEMLSGEPPFTGTTTLAVIAHRFTELPRRLRTLRAQIPEVVDAAVDRALAQLPADRFPTAAGFGEALSPAGASGPHNGGDVLSGSAQASIAVLPFLNLSADRENEYFSDGMTEEILNALSKVRELKVASRTSAFAFKGKDLDIREIAERLKVRTVLEGSVRRAGSRVRIVAQLINAADGYHVWSETYEREMADVFALQDEISRAIVVALESRLMERVPVNLVRPGTSNIEAYEFYLKGHYSACKRSVEGLSLGIEYFEQAVKRDPSYALAHAGLAECWALRGFLELGDLHADDAMPKAKAAALEALRLDSRLPEAHTWLGVIHFLFDWDFKAAEEELRRALQLRPDSAYAENWYALFLGAMGRHQEALERILHAQALEPLSLSIRLCVGRCYYFADLFERALECIEGILRDEPGHQLTTIWLARTLCALQRYSDALEAMTGIPPEVRTPYLSSLVASALAGLGRTDEARALCQELRREFDEGRAFLLFPVAAAYVRLGDYDAALDTLEEALRRREGYMPFVLTEPAFDEMRGHPRFERLLAELHFPPEVLARHAPEGFSPPVHALHA